MPWRLVALFREYTSRICVLIPYRAYSAASLLALGADEIVMHPFAELGPIDPTVSNDYNPISPQGQRLGISVEDVKAYIHFVKTTVGITHEDELVKALIALTEKVHPLALGNVERFISQSRLVARKLLATHMDGEDRHAIDEIVENMASKLYFHGHPINRHEAQRDLKLKVETNLQPELESAIWNLYLDFEAEFQNRSVFDPAAMIYSQTNPATPIEVELLHAVVESERLTSCHRTRHRYTPVNFAQPGQPAIPGQIAIRDEVLSQDWSHSPVPQAE